MWGERRPNIVFFWGGGGRGGCFNCRWEGGEVGKAIKIVGKVAGW